MGLQLLADCHHARKLSDDSDTIKKLLLRFQQGEDAFLSTTYQILPSLLRQLTQRKYSLNSFGATRPEPLGNAEVLRVLIEMAIECQLEAVFLLDNATLIRNGYVDDTVAQEYVKNVIEEAKNYQRSMVIFDLDSLANVSKNFESMTKDSAEALLFASRRETFGTTDRWGAKRPLDEDDGGNLRDEKFTYSMQRPNLLAWVLQEIVHTTSKDNLFWMVAISEDLVLTSKYKQMFTASQWPLSDEEQKIEVTERELKQNRTCVRCKKLYTEMDNSADSCGRHLMQLCVVLKSDKEKPLFFNTPEEFAEAAQKDKDLAVNVESARWLCCQRGIWDLGELPCSHTSGEEENL